MPNRPFVDHANGCRSARRHGTNRRLRADLDPARLHAGAGHRADVRRAARRGRSRLDGRHREHAALRARRRGRRPGLRRARTRLACPQLSKRRLPRRLRRRRRPDRRTGRTALGPAFLLQPRRAADRQRGHLPLRRQLACPTTATGGASRHHPSAPVVGAAAPCHRRASGAAVPASFASSAVDPAKKRGRFTAVDVIATAPPSRPAAPTASAAARRRR